MLRNGRLHAIEVKRPGGRPTDDQRAFLDRVRQNGGAALVVFDVTTLVDALDAEREVTLGQRRP